MPNNCPQCNSELVASSVGLLCSGCGTLHRFYKTGDINLKSSPAPEPAADNFHQAVDHQMTAIDTTAEPVNHPFSRRLKERMKRLVVPELPDPRDSSHLLESHLQPPLKPKVTQPIAQPLPTSRPSVQPNPTPVKIKHFNHRLPLVIFAIIALLVAGLVGAYLIFRPSSSNQTGINQAETKPPADPNTERAKRDSKRKSDIKEIATALEVYKRDNGGYPVGQQIQAVYVLSKAAPKYISYVNEDPLSTDTKRIFYSYRSDGKSFILSAKLENSQDAEAIDGYYIIQSN